MKVKLCDKNKGKVKIKQSLKDKLPDLDVKIKDCIGMCSDCSKKKIALLNGVQVKASDIKNLCKKIENILKDK